MPMRSTSVSVILDLPIPGPPAEQDDAAGAIL